jgi:cobalt-zinc-cadmium efflux system protein
VSGDHQRREAGSTHSHPHRVSSDADRGRLRVALVLIVAFMACEVIVGLVAQSLALLSDAGHMLTDAAALALSLVAMRLAAKPPKGGMTFGMKRAEVLSGLANGVTLLVIAVLIVYEAIRRLVAPPAVEGHLMLAVALAGVVVNLVATWQLARAERRSLNIRGSYQHLLTDLYAFIGTAIAAAVILLTGFERADPIASLLVAGLMLRAAYGLLRDGGRVLLEAAPEGVEPTEVAEAISGHPSVANVHDLHVWEITSGFPALSAHVLVRPGDDCHAVRRDLERLLDEKFEIEHTTLQVDHVSQPQLIEVRPVRGSGSTEGG